MAAMRRLTRMMMEVLMASLEFKIVGNCAAGKSPALQATLVVAGTPITMAWQYIAEGRHGSTRCGINVIKAGNLPHTPFLTLCAARQ